MTVKDLKYSAIKQQSMDEEESQEQSESQVYLTDLGLDIVHHITDTCFRWFQLNSINFFTTCSLLTAWRVLNQILGVLAGAWTFYEGLIFFSGAT